MPIEPEPSKGLPTTRRDQAGPAVLLDAPLRSRVAVPLMPEFAVVATLVLIAAPVVLVGGTILAAMARSWTKDTRSRDATTRRDDKRLM